jgi:uncharacterized membrane protein
MDSKSKEMLDSIRAKRPAELNDTEKGILRARRTYLSESELTDFAEILNDGEEVKPEVSAPAEAVSAPVEATSEAVATPEVPVDLPAAPVDETPSKKAVSQMNKTELLAEATERGVDVPEGASNAAIRELLK